MRRFASICGPAAKRKAPSVHDRGLPDVGDKRGFKLPRGWPSPLGRTTSHPIHDGGSAAYGFRHEISIRKNTLQKQNFAEAMRAGSKFALALS